MRDQAQIVVVGGGIIGCAVAYHLGRAGYHDVCVIDKGQLASGTTSQGAGLIGQLRSSPVKFRLIQWTMEDLEVLRREMGEETGFRQVGSLRLALTAEREAEIQSLMDFARRQGIHTEPIDAREAEKIAPGFDWDRVRLAAWVPTDGYVEPYTLTHAYARCARRSGVEFCTGVRVIGIDVDNGRVSQIITDEGEIKTEWVVDAAGAWSELIAAMAGVEIPVFPVRHQSWITAPLDWIPPEYPTLRMPDLWTYLRPEVGGLLIGLFEPDSTSVDIRGLPESFEIPQLLRDWGVLTAHIGQLCEIMPVIQEAPIINATAGLPTFTPDGHFVVGTVPGVGGLLVATGCCAQGIVGSGAIGRLVTELISGETPSLDPAIMAVGRFGSQFRERATLRRACEQTYGSYHSLPVRLS